MQTTAHSRKMLLNRNPPKQPIVSGFSPTSPCYTVYLYNGPTVPQVSHEWFQIFRIYHPIRVIVTFLRYALEWQFWIIFKFSGFFSIVYHSFVCAHDTPFALRKQLTHVQTVYSSSPIAVKSVTSSANQSTLSPASGLISSQSSLAPVPSTSSSLGPKKSDSLGAGGV